MDIQKALMSLLFLVLTGVLPLALKYAVVYLNAKIKDQAARLESDKLEAYIDSAMDAITSAVLAVNQTYVDTLKKAGEFDKEAQALAKQKALTLAKSMITDDCKAAIETLYSDYAIFLNAKIEEIVRENKI